MGRRSKCKSTGGWMPGMKDTVHTEYLKSIEQKKMLPELPWAERTVLVIGSDEDNNVGACVGQAVSMLGARVIETRSATSTIGVIESDSVGATDLVICCASVWMDWIEDVPYSKVQQVISDSLICPIQYTRAFVSAHLNSPHRKHIVFIGSMAHRKVLNAS